MMRNLKFAWAGLIVVLLIGGCGSMSEKFDPVAERPVVEQVIKNSITWAMNKDTELLYRSFVNDSTLFYFSPDNAGTISGFDAFTKLTEEVFMNPAFKAVGSDFKNMRVTFSNSGECAWWSCYLDDFNEWDGRPANWENVRWTGVLEKIDGEWKIRQMHFSHAVEDFQDA
jgi:ketosteroid isomerase-like protein